jgi:hypothetical protein
MVVRHYARSTRKPDPNGAERLDSRLPRRDLSRRKCQKFARKLWIQTLGAKVSIDSRGTCAVFNLQSPDQCSSNGTTSCP